jgi:hypothetical protein
MTLAMISLVVFALTMMSTMNLNFDRLFLADTARGGWDVIVDENPNNPIYDLPAVLRAAGSDAPDSFRAVGRVTLDTTAQVTECGPSNPNCQRFFSDYPVLGVDEGFVDGGDITLSARSREFDSDEAVWQAMKDDLTVAVVDGFTVQSGHLFQEDTLSISRSASLGLSISGPALPSSVCTSPAGCLENSSARAISPATTWGSRTRATPRPWPRTSRQRSSPPASRRNP